MILIDKNALMQSLGITNMDCEKCEWYDKEWSRCKRGGDFEDACIAIDYAPTIEERKKGEWLPDNNNPYETRFICSACMESQAVPTIGFTKYKPLWDYCPYGGADMRGEGNG